jgi:outer membrane protein
MKMTKLLIVALLFFSILAVPAWATEHTIGFGVGFTPDYEGSEDYQGIPMLMLRGRYDSGRSFSLTGTNLRVNIVPSKDYSFGPILNYRHGRDDVENDRVDAMRDIDAALELGFYGSINLNNWQLSGDFLADVSDEHDGMLGKASLGYRWKVSPELTIIPRAFTTYADGDYMNTYFGVNQGNRGTSGLPGYSADKGFKDAGVNLAIDYTPWEKWGISGMVSYSALLGDAKDSPIVEDEGDDKQLFFGVMGTYRWGSR